MKFLRRRPESTSVILANPLTALAVMPTLNPLTISFSVRRPPGSSGRCLVTLRHLVAVSLKQSEHHDIILDIYVSGLEHWMSGTTLLLSDYPTKFHDLIASQESIGWNQLLCGRLSILWAKHIDEFPATKPTHHPSLSGHLWVKLMTLTLWDQFFVLWEESIYGSN
jgi:hypothetical protein